MTLSFVYQSWISKALGKSATMIMSTTGLPVKTAARSVSPDCHSFVLGLFTSLSLARTYYSNRALLGTVFAKVLGLGMFAASFIRALSSNPTAARRRSPRR